MIWIFIVALLVLSIITYFVVLDRKMIKSAERKASTINTVGDFSKYYKFPLKMWEGTTGKIFTDDNKMAFDWLLPYGKQYNGIKQRLLNRINGYDYTPWGTKKTFYKNDNGHIVCKIEDGKNAGKEIKVLLVRGWGMLTGVGGYHLPVEEASKIQDEFTAHILRCLND